MTRLIEVAPNHPVGECIVWQGAKNDRGYGQVRVEGTTYYVHRLSAAFKYGGIPDGLTVDHLCFNPSCYNPDHLDLCTTGENTRRYFRRKTECNYGHPLDGLRKNGRRHCLTCRREEDRRRRARR